MSWEHDYLDLLEDTVTYGKARPNRTGINTYTFTTGATLRVPLLNHRIPLPITKKLNFSACFEELLWFLRGHTNTASLNSRIWDAWADTNGDLGPIYGKQWRDWSGVDQFAELLGNLETNPFSRRHIVSAWNVSDLPKMALPPCHLMWMVDVDSDFGITLTVIQRSADLPVGVPFNLLSYSALAHLIVQEMSCRQPGTPWHAKELVWFGNNCHVYENQVDGVREQLSHRDILDNPNGHAPRLQILNGAIPLLDRLGRGWTQDNYFYVTGNRPLGPIRFPVAT